MRVLRLFFHAVVHGIWRKFGGKILLQPIPDVFDRRVRYTHRIGTHIRDKTDAARSDIDAFIELLGNLHGFTRRKAEFVRRRLLEFRRRKRRLRLKHAVARFYIGDYAVGIFNFFNNILNALFRLQLDLFTLVLYQFGGKRGFTFFKVGFERPIFFG